MWMQQRTRCGRQKSTEYRSYVRRNTSPNGLTTTELDCRLGMILASGIGRDVGGCRIGFDVAVLDQPAFHFLTAYVGENLAVDFQCRLQRLAASGHHLLIVLGIVNDVAVVKRKIILPQ